MSQPLPRYLPTDHAEWEQKLAAILIETGEPAPPANVTRKLAGHRSSETDKRRLRAIPCRPPEGLAGVIPDTQPLHALLEKERRQLRIADR